MSRFNLLEQAWIPVKGRSELIKVCEIVRPDILGLDAPRADFNAALMQLLIGVVQTVFAPEDEMDWEDFYEEPPSEALIQEKLDAIKPAFYLDGDGCRFMQDGLAKEVGKHLPIEEMIFGAPGGSGKEGNKDHFTKRNDINGLCFSCSASGLLTANLFAEDGGQSYYPTMRGNGFISNLVCLDESVTDSSLWKNIWVNVLERQQKNNWELDLSKIFFWCKDLPDKPEVEKINKVKIDLTELKSKKKATKDKEIKEEIDNTIKLLEKEKKAIQYYLDKLGDEKIVFPAEENYLQVYWAWMRRFLLDTENIDNGRCGVCNTNSKLIRNFYKKNKGYKYPKEHWQDKHPFSPSEKYERASYDENNEKYKDKMLALSMSINGLPYTYWQDFLVQTPKNSPAKVVIQHLKKKNLESQLVIWSFGYAMDSNSPLGWYESVTPLYLLTDENQRKIVESEIHKYIQASNKISDNRNGYLINAIKNAWFDENKEKNKDQKKSFNDNRAIEIGKSFWDRTHDKFYQLIDDLYKAEGNLDETETIKIRNEWYRHIYEVSENLFKEWAFKSSIQTNPRRIALAHNQLMQNLHSKSLKQDTLGLTKEHEND